MNHAMAQTTTKIAIPPPIQLHLKEGSDREKQRNKEVVAVRKALLI